MKTILSKKVLLTYLFITLTVLSFIIILNVKNLSVYATEFEVFSETDSNYEELVKFNNDILQSGTTVFSNGGSDRSEKIGVISGTDTHTLMFSDLTDVKYIPNSNYFLINPWHHNNDGTDNAGGTCTTVATQMLLGYHNYYSDRRLIPSSGNGRIFLDTDYGNLNGHPALSRAIMPASHQGCLQIGTADGVYQEIFDLTWISDWYGIGQAVGLVKDGAISFINNYTPAEVKSEVSISSGVFSKETAISDINSGIPIILGCQPIFTGAESFHVVLAYGYAKLDGVEGFLVHYGWGDSRTQVWMPASWFAFQIRMSVNHMHSFIDTGNIINNTHRELLCGTCGFRTLELLYNISNDSINYVKYPLFGAITIPSSIKIYLESNATFVNNPINTIEANAFENCSNLTSITCFNLQIIGDFAFKGCRSLTSINIPASVTSIGDGAFAGCNNLNITVESGNPNYCVSNNILYNKAKTKIISACNVPTEIVIPNTVTEISSYAFENNDKIRFVHFNNNVSIGTDSFNNCDFLTGVYFYSTDLPNLGMGSFANNDFTVYSPMISQTDYKNAFASYTDKIDSILVHIDFKSDGNILYGRDVYYGSLLSELPTPEKTGYNLLGWNESNIFEGNQFESGDLWLSKTNSTLYAEWSPKQYYIDFEGFASEGLTNKTVTYDSPIGTLPSVVRNGYTFLGWKAQDGQYYDANTLWTETNNMVLTSDWDANTYTITYDGNGGTTSASTQQVVYGSTVNELATAERIGYDFVGWNTMADGSGEMNSTPFISAIDSDITLYAKWDAIDYQITYDLDGGSLTQSNPSTYTILSNDITLNNPTKIGYSFVGWYDGDDIVTEILTGSYGNRYLTARWTANHYTVTLDAYGGLLDGANSFTVTYGSAFTTTANVHKNGYTFDGWYDSENIKYITDSGESVICWNKPYNATLYAHWSIKSYEIQINNNGTITWLNSNGLSNEQCSIEYGTVLSSINLIAIYKQSNQGYKEGKIFDHFEYEDSNVNWTSVPDLGENGSIITITPVWILEEHTIYFNTLYSATFEPIVADFDANITLPNINRNGYNFNGWYTSTTEGTEITWIKMPDLSLNNQNNGSITLFARYDLIQYDVTYNLDGGMNASDNPTSYNIESNIILHNPIKAGYNFAGWYSDINKTIQVTTLGNTTGNKILYAKWTPITYIVKYNANGGVGNTEEITHTYGVAKNLMANSFTKTGYHFIGWATSSTGNVIYSNSQSVINLTTVDNYEIILYAKWDKNTYYVVYDANGGIGSMDSSIHTYDVYKELNKNTFTLSGYVFSGWSTNPNGSVDYNDSQNVINLTSIQNDEFILYAIWNKIYTVRFYKEDGTYYYGTSGVAGTPIYLPTLTKGGYLGTWNRWGWVTGNSNISNFGYRYYISSDISLTVIWKEKTLAECYNNGIYEIWTLNQFNGLRTIGTSGKTFKLLSDIDLKTNFDNPWTPFYGFGGVLQGNHKTINNMYISATSSYNYYGLFDTNAGTIENLTVNGYIDNAGSSSIYAGLIAGINWSSGVIRNCQSSLAPFNNYFARTEITDNGYIAWNFEIHANNSNAQVGGICGQNQGSIINCVNYADIFGKGDIGGIAGANHGGTITSCTNNGELNYWYQDTNRCVGGITGYFYNGAITNCKNQSPIKCVNASFSDETSIYPAIGQIIGRKVAGTNSGNSYGANPNYNQSYYADGYEGCFVSKGALREFKHGGFLGIGQSTHNQAMYVKNGEIGQIG